MVAVAVFAVMTAALIYLFPEAVYALVLRGERPVSRLQRVRGFPPAVLGKLAALPIVAVLILSAAHWFIARPVLANKFTEPETQERPQPVPPTHLDRTLKTISVPRDRPAFNLQMVDTSLRPRDEQGIWVLDFRFKPLRIKTVEIPGKGRRQIHYLYYSVVNRTGKPRKFAPHFIMVNEQHQQFEDEAVPEAIPAIQVREDPTIPVLGAVDIIGTIPQSFKADVDDAVFGVACWEKWDPKSDRFSIYVRGLSDGREEVPAAGGDKPIAKEKTLRIDFIRRGDNQLAEPPYEWVYW
jgi:hypothetical protein